MLFSILSIVLSIQYYDADYVGKRKIATACLILIFGISIIESNMEVNLVVVTVFRYRAQVELEKAQNILDKEEGIHSSGKTWQIGMEMVILLFQPYFFVNGICLIS